MGLRDHKHRYYRDRNLRKTLYEKLLIEFVEGKFNEDDIRKEWHNLLTQYKREKQRHESSKTSGSGSSKVYIPTWTFFDEMSFADLTLDVDESLTTLGVVKPPKKLKVAEDVKVEAEKAKIEVWKALVS